MSEGAHRADQPRRLVRAVECYQRMTAGRPSPCRFTPSCSTYALEALSTYGTRRGLWLAARRLLRCRPFGPSGYDPVPEPDLDIHHGELALLPLPHQHGSATTIRRATKDR